MPLPVVLEEALAAVTAADSISAGSSRIAATQRSTSPSHRCSSWVIQLMLICGKMEATCSTLWEGWARLWLARGPSASPSSHPPWQVRALDFTAGTVPWWADRNVVIFTGAGKEEHCKGPVTRSKSGKSSESSEIQVSLRQESETAGALLSVRSITVLSLVLSLMSSETQLSLRQESKTASLLLSVCSITVLPLALSLMSSEIQVSLRQDSETAGALLSVRSITVLSLFILVSSEIQVSLRQDSETAGALLSVRSITVLSLVFSLVSSEIQLSLRQESKRAGLLLSVRSIIVLSLALSLVSCHVPPGTVVGVFGSWLLFVFLFIKYTRPRGDPVLVVSGTALCPCLWDRCGLYWPSDLHPALITAGDLLREGRAMGGKSPPSSKRLTQLPFLPVCSSGTVHTTPLPPVLGGEVETLDSKSSRSTTGQSVTSSLVSRSSRSITGTLLSTPALASRSWRSRIGQPAVTPAVEVVVSLTVTSALMRASKSPLSVLQHNSHQIITMATVRPHKVCFLPASIPPTGKGVSQRWICLHSNTCYHSETEVAYRGFPARMVYLKHDI